MDTSEAKERQLVMMVIDLARSQETLEENHDYCHSTDCSNAWVGCFLPAHLCAQVKVDTRHSHPWKRRDENATYAK